MNQVISRMPEDRRLAALLAFGGLIEAGAHDYARDIFDHLIPKLFAPALQVLRSELFQAGGLAGPLCGGSGDKGRDIVEALDAYGTLI